MFTGGDHEGEAIGQFAGEPLYHGSLDPEEYRRRLDDAGFEIIEQTQDDAETGGSAIWLAQLR